MIPDVSEKFKISKEFAEQLTFLKLQEHDPANLKVCELSDESGYNALDSDFTPLNTFYLKDSNDMKNLIRGYGKKVLMVQDEGTFLKLILLIDLFHTSIFVLEYEEDEEEND